MKIIPLADRVVIKTVEVEETTKGGLILTGSAKEITDLTDFPVDAWEPSHDTELWKQERKLHLFVQRTRQGDGEHTAEIEPQMVYVLETDLSSK